MTLRMTVLSALLLASTSVTPSTSAQASGPGGRTGAYMVYDSARAQTILFGGWTRSGSSGTRMYPDDLWAWDGERWKRLEPPADREHPLGRDVPVLAYDASRERLVMFGGRREDGSVPAA